MHPQTMTVDGVQLSEEFNVAVLITNHVVSTTQTLM